MDAFCMCISLGNLCDIHILREALTARFIAKGIPEPQIVGRVADTDSHAFFMLFFKTYCVECWIIQLKMKVLQTLQEALDNITNDYLVYDNEEKETLTHLERIFAYELYHQWSISLKNLKSKNKNDSNIQKLLLNGELSKEHFNGKLTYPDLVLHEGQDSTNQQLIACEIKRFDKLTLKNLIHDLYKLSCYVNPKEKSADYRYKLGIMIIIGCSKDKLYEKFNKIKYRKKTNNKEEIEHLNNTIKAYKNVIKIFICEKGYDDKDKKIITDKFFIEDFLNNTRLGLYLKNNNGNI